MSDFELQQQRNTSRSCNENVLLDIGFCRVGNSSLYNKRGTQAYILSPGISQGKHEKYWFDIREANLQKIGESPKAWVLLRIVPSWFAFFPIAHIRKYMNTKTQDFRSNSGLVYGFYCELDERNRLIRITSKNHESFSFANELLDRTKVEQTLTDEINI
jgi:hypothetical protein